jgi:hypothetical protein
MLSPFVKTGTSIIAYGIKNRGNKVENIDHGEKTITGSYFTYEDSK